MREEKGSKRNEKKKKMVKFRLNFATTSGWLANSVLMHGTKGGWTRAHTEAERERERGVGRRITRGILPTMQLESIPWTAMTTMGQ